MLKALVMATANAVLEENLQDPPPPLFVAIYRFGTLYAAEGEMQGQLQEKIAYIAKELQDLANLVLAGTCRTYIGLIWI